jgi:hypothetical protein
MKNTFPAWLTMESAPKDGSAILAVCRHDANPYQVDGKLTPYGAHCEACGYAEDGVHLLKWENGYEETDDPRGPGYFVPGWWFLRDGPEMPANPVGWIPVPPMSPLMHWQLFDVAMLNAEEWDQQSVMVELHSSALHFGRVICGDVVGYDPHADRYNDPIDPEWIHHIMRIHRP